VGVKLGFSRSGKNIHLRVFENRALKKCLEQSGKKKEVPQYKLHRKWFHSWYCASNIHMRHTEERREIHRDTWWENLPEMDRREYFCMDV